MGISTDAMLMYGINIGDDLETVAKQFGWKPDEENPEPDLDWFAEYIEEQLPKSLEMTLIGHPDSCSSYVITGKHITAHRGYEKEVTALPKPSKPAKTALEKLENRLDIRAACWLASYADF